MSKVTDELRGHRFDGIEEYDNPLPRWWLGIFYVTIAFALVYVPYVHMSEGNTIHDEYAADMAKASELMAAQKIDWNDDELKAYCTGSESWKAAAKTNYDGKCAACHRADGGGLVGPAFTDDAYIHGGKYADIAKVITEGVQEKGMIAWGKQLKKEEIQDLACYVRALRGNKVENPKAPQGDVVAE